MSFEVFTIPPFDRQAKRLSKKYPSFKQDLLKIILQLKESPTMGKPLGSNLFKVRFAVSSKNKGKSGGARLITYVKIMHSEIYLIAVYDKSEQTDISDEELAAMLYFISDDEAE